MAPPRCLSLDLTKAVMRSVEKCSGAFEYRSRL
jgi:hypothetical protein